MNGIGWCWILEWIKFEYLFDSLNRRFFPMTMEQRLRINSQKVVLKKSYRFNFGKNKLKYRHRQPAFYCFFCEFVLFIDLMIARSLMFMTTLILKFREYSEFELIISLNGMIFARFSCHGQLEPNQKWIQMKSGNWYQVLSIFALKLKHSKNDQIWPWTHAYFFGNPNESLIVRSRRREGNWTMVNCK